MTDANHSLINDAKNNRFSSLDGAITDNDVSSVWDTVSSFIEKNMSQLKGVCLKGLGTFTFSQKTIYVSNNKHILMQRPVFVLAESFAQTHGIEYVRPHVSDHIPVMQLNYSAIAVETPFSRDIVETCIREVLQAFTRSLAAKRNVEFSFCGIGRLEIRDSKVKMKFYKDFVNSMDGTGKLVNAMKDRPGTVDSVMSECGPSRAHSNNTLLLPRIERAASGLGMDTEQDQRATGALEPIAEHEEMNSGNISDDMGEQAENVDQPASPNGSEALAELDDEEKNNEAASVLSGSRLGSRVAAPLAKVVGVSFLDELVPSALGSPKGLRTTPQPSSRANFSPAISRRSLSPLNPPPSADRPKSMDSACVQKMNKLNPLPRVQSDTAPRADPLDALSRPSTSASSCGHPTNAGQELCYLCHQRARRNVAVSFTEERRKREREDDRLIQQYQSVIDADAMHKEHEKFLTKRHEQKKMAAFNMGVSEAVANKNQMKDEYHPSFIFTKRPRTASKFVRQAEYNKQLAEQVKCKDEASKKEIADEKFLEKLEQVQLAEDLAMQREEYLRNKIDDRDQYKRELSAQVKMKPAQIPARVPDSTEVIFGKGDMVNEKLVEKRRAAERLLQEQVGAAEQRKREGILQRVSDQREEEDMLTRTRQELLADRARRYERLFDNRRRLQQDWSTAAEEKGRREQDERAHMATPGDLVHEQCDRYKRCGQCKRRTDNCGETNIWQDTRYIPGTRLMV